MSKYSCICFTIWAFDEEIQNYFSYLIVGKEICPETGKLHFQCYGELKIRATLGSLKNKLGKEAHIERRMGTQKQAVEYCMKEDDFAEYGTPKKQGERTDLTTVCAMTLDHTLGEVASAHPEMFVKYHKGLGALKDKYIYEMNKKTLRNVSCAFIFGPTGSGKTRTVWERECDSLYILPPSIRGSPLWFNGYDGKSVLLIDDYVPHSIEPSMILRICDRYPLQVPTKGGMVWANWDRVYITSNKNWCECFDHSYCYEGMCRRIPENQRVLMASYTIIVQEDGQEVDG